MIFRSLLALSILALAGAARAQTADFSSLHDALHLSAGQEEAWRIYTSAVSPDPQSEARHRAAAMLMSTLPTPRRVDLINAEMDEDAANLHRQGEAVKTFYATLTPDQQRTFDRQTMSNAGQGGGGGSTRQPPAGGSLRPPSQP